MVGLKTAELMEKSIYNNQLWYHLRQVSHSDTILKEMLDQALTYYLLKYNHDDYKNRSKEGR